MAQKLRLIDGNAAKAGDGACIAIGRPRAWCVAFDQNDTTTRAL